MRPQPVMIHEVPRPTPRRVSGHKGDYGRVLVAAGSQDMPGAAALCARSALAGGAGLVTMALPRAARAMAAVMCPCATSRALDDDAEGFFAPAAALQLADLLDGCDVAAVGPGMGVSTAGAMVVTRALGARCPLVLDADGLNNLASIADWPAERRCELVLTPHPGEMARLCGLGVSEVQADRRRVACAMAERWSDRRGSQGPPLVVVLKGASTVVADGRRCYINATGNPGMATGGSGDVLTGLLAALIGQGMSGFDAAVAAVWTHGRAGDLAAEALGQLSVTAEVILDHLPAALMELIRG